MKEIKIELQHIKKAVSKIGIANIANKHSAISNLLEINVFGFELHLKITDLDNFVDIKVPIKEKSSPDSEFNVFINQEQFCKLINRLNNNVISIVADDNGLFIKSGNGNYDFELVEDEFNSWELVEGNDIKEVNKQDLLKILTTAPSAVAGDAVIPILQHYFFGNSVYSSNRLKLCKIDINLLDTEMIMSRSLFNMLSIFDGDNIRFSQTEEGLIFSSDDVIIRGLNVPSDDTYNTGVFDTLISKSLQNYIIIKKYDLLSVLDRMSIFVKENDKGEILLDVSNNKLRVTNKIKKSVDYIDISESSINDADFVMRLNIDYLSSLIKFLDVDTIRIEYDAQVGFIKIVIPKVVQLLSLIEGE